jgi:hypothetical protein
MNKIARDKTKIKQKLALLERQSELLKEELEGELVVTKKKVADLGKITLGVGAGLVFTVILIGSFGSKKGKRKTKSGGTRRVYHRFLDQLTSELTERATDFILGVAKEKLRAYKDKTVEDDDSEITD